ncbi:hypothetical protein GCM10010978_15290 [Compostibacillus humi]|uniref:Flagellar protein FlaG n=1 Tax=Compostibacillus humi TaxID=1245525 RepID=A0A8J2ZSW1_9BACI|nr:flagellar protein FlaG [Compostibacillus humi]GGH75431.1 hypothetical protein GCM10010978_15290 [Compostibacillus humi]
MQIDRVTVSQPMSRVNYNVERTTVSDRLHQQMKKYAEKETPFPEEKKHVEDTVNSFNEFMQPMYTNLKFVLHDKLGEYYVKVVDIETDEVIKEIPPEKMLDMYAQMAEFMGLLIDEKV